MPNTDQVQPIKFRNGLVMLIHAVLKLIPFNKWGPWRYPFIYQAESATSWISATSPVNSLRPGDAYMRQ